MHSKPNLISPKQKMYQGSVIGDKPTQALSDQVSQKSPNAESVLGIDGFFNAEKIDCFNLYIFPNTEKTH
jgi:hypothetical protein